MATQSFKNKIIFVLLLSIVHHNKGQTTESFGGDSPVTTSTTDVVVPTRSCSIRDIDTTNVKILCETKRGLSISCLEPTATRAYVSCYENNYNPAGIKQQIIHCLDNGTWSEPPLDCKEKCALGAEVLVSVYKRHKTFKFPTALIEVVHRRPGRAKPRIIFPSFIVNEDHIFTRSDIYEYFHKYVKDEGLIVRLPKSKSPPVEFPIFLGEIPADLKREGRNFTLLRLPQTIEFDEDTKADCDYSRVEANELAVKPYRVFRDENNDHCIVPRVESAKVEVKCFDSTTDVRTPLDCSVQGDEVVTRCQIGYQLANRTNLQFLSTCVRGDWRLYSDYDSCELMCGVRYNETAKNPFSPLIFNGTETNPVSAPWHVGVYANNTEDSTGFEHICGGSIIHSNIIISTAHCFYDDELDRLNHPSNYIVGAGKRFRSYTTLELNEFYVQVKQIHIPFNFQIDPVLNDIAVVILEEHFTFTTHIWPVCIDLSGINKKVNVPGRIGLIVGWGATTATSEASTVLRQTELRVVTGAECRNFTDSKFRSEVTEDRFCAVNEAAATACGGDSGGGFTVEVRWGERVRYVLAGAISAGLNPKKYCAPGFVTLFTNIEYHRDFMKKIISMYRDDKPDELLRREPINFNFKKLTKA